MSAPTAAIPCFSPTIRRREMDAVLTCLVDEKVGPGEMNARLSQAVRDFFGAAGAVALRSPELALSYALRALDVSPPRKVIVSALAPSWQYDALRSLGLGPVVVDVDERTGAVGAESAEEGVGAGGSVLLLHEPMGIVPNAEEMGRILSLGIPVIEDVSQSAGAVSVAEAGSDGTLDLGLDEAPAEEKAEEGRRAGTLGVFSIMGLEERDSVTGGGGAVLVAPEKRAWTVLCGLCGSAPRTHSLPDMNSALAFVQLREFQRNEEARRSLASSYARAMAGAGNRANAAFGRGRGDSCPVFPVVLFGSWDEARQYAARKGVEIARAFGDTVLERLSRADGGDGSLASVEGLPRAKSLFLRTALFPLYPRMRSDAAAKVAKILASLP